jgi:hypothetical protein
VRSRITRQAIYKRLDKDKAAQGGELAALPSPPRQTERAKNRDSRCAHVRRLGHQGLGLRPLLVADQCGTAEFLAKDKAAQGGELAALPSPPRQTERAKKAA